MGADTESGSDRRPVQILLVEDNPGDVRLTREMLRESKVRNDLTVANSAEEAERMLGLAGEAEDEPFRPDLVLLDLNLPGKSGHELLKEIKEHSELRRVPVVILSSSEAEADIEKSYDQYANAYVTKPLDLDEMAKVVATIDEFWFEIVRLADHEST